MKKTGARLLIVDDDMMLREFTERAVMSLGYDCVCAMDATSAIERLDEDETIEGMIIDMRLGKGPSGADLALRALGKWPGLGIILTSGDPLALEKAGLDLPEAVLLLPKPYRRGDLADRLARLQ